MRARILVLACALFAGCSKTEQVREQKYYDIKGFFSKEIKRLEKQKAHVKKTVTRNGSAESKSSVSPVWVTELALFTESDINKPAWSDSYKIQTDSTGISYIAKDDELRTQTIHIKKNKKGELTEIAVVSKTSNYLYNSSEELVYITDSLYRIIKKQDVILLGKNNYQINGIF